jgi:8-oxo-dGTP pyrophosphatase MutT (NUDIX family)
MTLFVSAPEVCFDIFPAARVVCGARRSARVGGPETAASRQRTYNIHAVPSHSRPLVAKPASTVVVLRDSPAGPEVFMVRRHEATAFMAGAHVFPGGRVDASDRGADDMWCDGIDHAVAQLAALAREDALAYHVAAARELFEEAGVLLARDPRGDFVALGGADMHARFKQYRHDVHSGARTLRSVLDHEQLRLALDALVMFAHWVTPPVDTRRFDTRFFLARVPPGQTPAHDERETTHSTWITAAGAIAAANADQIVLPPPTWTTLRELEAFADVGAALAWARRRRIIRREPKAIEKNGVRMLLMPGDPLHPEPAVDEPLGETRFLLVDGRWRAEHAPPA